MALEDAVRDRTIETRDASLNKSMIFEVEEIAKGNASSIDTEEGRLLDGLGDLRNKPPRRRAVCKTVDRKRLPRNTTNALRRIWNVSRAGGWSASLRKK